MRLAKFMVLLAIVMLPTMATSAMLEYQSVGLNSIAEFHFAPSVFDGQSIRIGELNFLLDGVPTTSLCANAEGNMLGAPYEVEIVDLATQSLGLNKAAYLYRNYFAALSDGVQAAGLQVAIWEVIHDDNNPETGALYITGNAAVVPALFDYSPRQNFVINSIAVVVLSESPFICANASTSSFNSCATSPS